MKNYRRKIKKHQITKTTIQFHDLSFHLKIYKINAKIKNEKYVQANNTHFNQSNVKIRAFSLIPLMNDNFCRVDYCGIGVGEVGSTYLDRNGSNKKAEIIEGMLIKEGLVRIVLEHHDEIDGAC